MNRKRPARRQQVVSVLFVGTMCLQMLLVPRPPSVRADEYTPAQLSQRASFAIPYMVEDPEVDVDYWLPQLLDHVSDADFLNLLAAYLDAGDFDAAEFLAEVDTLLEEYGVNASNNARCNLAATGNRFGSAAAQRKGWRKLTIKDLLVAVGGTTCAGCAWLLKDWLYDKALEKTAGVAMDAATFLAYRTEAATELTNSGLELWDDGREIKVEDLAEGERWWFTELDGKEFFKLWSITEGKWIFDKWTPLGKR